MRVEATFQPTILRENTSVTNATYANPDLGVTDPHFHEIVHDVRRAVPDRPGTFGTVITLKNSPVMQRLWEGDLDFVPISAPRMLDIFLDALMAHAATTHSYLLADGYASALPEADAALRTALLDSVKRLPATAQNAAAWPVISSTLRALGLGVDGRASGRG